ncbi:MAG: hypothetical protein ACYC8T_32340 [Myxococcaceae bacterium]
MTRFALAGGLVAATFCGCTFTPGGPFATLEPRFTASLATPPERDLGDGWLKLSSEYQFKPSSAVIELGPIELKDFGSAASLGFDPAHPPPGYTLCHGGHCHRDDGALIPYAEIAASLGGGGGPKTAVTLDAVAAELLGGGAPAELGCAPSCELLEQGKIAQAKAPVVRFFLEGLVHDGRPAPRIVGVRPLRVELRPDAGTRFLTGELDLPADRVAPPDVRLDLSFSPGPGLLDAVDFAAATETAGGYELDGDSNVEDARSVEAALAEVPLVGEVRR